jgi:nicotinamidase-related amidase
MSQGAEQNYRESGFHQDMGFGETPALLMVDFVEAYLDKDSPLYAGVEAVRDCCVELLEITRTAGIPIFHTNVRYRPGSPDGGMFRRKLPLLEVFEEGSPLAAFAGGLEPADGESVVTKQYASAFFGTPLASSLTMLGIDSVLIAGVTTSGCIRASALDALQHGFRSIVVRDAVGDRHPDPHEANLFDLQAKYSDLVTVDDVRQYLESRKWGN